MKQKETTIDLLRIIAIWAVILIHTTSTTLAVSGYYLHHIPFTFFLNQSSRFAVPLFFLISGYVLKLRYPKTLRVSTFYKKRLLKLALPFFIWSFIYYSFIAHAGVKAFFSNLPSLLSNGSAAEHLYFIPAIALLYISFPLSNHLIEKFVPKKYPLFYFSFFLVGFSLLFVDYYGNGLFLPTPIRIALLNLPIFTLGMVWAKYKTAIKSSLTKRWIFFLSVLSLLSFLLVITEGHILSINTNHLAYFMSQWRPSILLYTICIFIFGLLYLPKFHGRLLTFFSSVTFFIFFSHVLFIHLFWKSMGAYLFSHSMGHITEQVWFDPLVFFFVLICSYISAFCVSRIPIVRTILGIN